MKIPCVKGAIALATLCFLMGCESSPRGPYVSTGEQQHNPAKAEALYRDAVKRLHTAPADNNGDGDRAEAESLLREALSYDLYHGPAHNNLGVLLLKQDHLYDAAEEFEWARKLLPGNPEPRVNLAIALERGGKHVDAIEAAKSALEVAPGNLAAMQSIAWIQVRECLLDASTSELLAQIRNRSEQVQWREWAGRNIILNRQDALISAPK